MHLPAAGTAVPASSTAARPSERQQPRYVHSDTERAGFWPMPLDECRETCALVWGKRVCELAPNADACGGGKHACFAKASA